MVQTEKPASQAPAPESTDALIFKIPEIMSVLGKNGELPPIFDRFMEIVAPSMVLPRSSEFILEAFATKDVTAEKASQALYGNAYLQQVFTQVIESVSKRKEGESAPSIEAAIVLLGMQNSRDLILAVQTQRSVLGVHPEFTAEGKLKVAPKDFLKYAIATEEATSGSKEEFLDLAFAGGFLFDLFLQIGGPQEHSKKLLPFIDQVYKQGFKAAQIGVEIARVIPEFGFRRYLFAACLVHDIGKLAMAVVEPTYIDYLDEISKKDFPRAIRRHLELKRFGVNHSLLGAIVCYHFRPFSKMARAILYQHEPFLLLSREKKLFDLAALVSLSSNIASNFKQIEKPDDPIVERWKTPALESFKIDLNKVVKAVGKVT